MKSIVSIGFSCPLIDNNYVRFDSHSSLSDYDIAIFYPSFINTLYTRDSPHPTYEGKDLYSKESSVKITENVLHWAKEIKSLLDNNKNIYVILCQKKDFYVHTGTNERSGTGRNQKVINHVSDFHNYRFLPSYIGDISNSVGQVIVPSHPVIKLFYDLFKDHMNYESYIKPSDEKSAILFTTKNKDKVLGNVYKKDRGAIIFLPNIEFNDEELIEYDNQNEEVWTKEALKLGKVFQDHILKIDKSISGDFTKTPTPDWVSHNSYELRESEITKEKIRESELKIIEIQKTIGSLNNTLENQENLKGLLYETGKPLENAVIQALNLLGYSAENYNDGKLELDQVINSPEGNRYIGECEGKDNKDIDISKFRQLQDSLNEDFQREEVTEKAFGILFGNPQRLISPSKRTLDFTTKCKSGADREKIGLIQTADLFKVAKYLLENNDEDYKKLCREEIHSQLGKVIKFPAIPKISISKKSNK